MKLKKTNNEIPKRNYVICAFLVVLVVLATILFNRWYSLREDLNKEPSIMSQFLVSMNEEEFENYTLENSNIIIYLASSKDETISEFEKEFKEFLVKYNLQSQVVFINLENINKDFFDNMKNNYFAENVKNIPFEKYTNLLIMENGKINSVLYTKKTDININDVKELFYNRGVIGQAW